MNVPLPTTIAGFQIVHDELKSLQKQVIIYAPKFLAHNIAIEYVGLVIVKAAEGAATIELHLALGSIIDF